MIDTAELDDRILKCERILTADANSQIFAALAEAYRKKGDLQKAEEVCRKGLKIHPGYSSARIVMAKIYMAYGDFEKAWDELNISVKTTGRTRAIDILESEILIRTGKTNEAKAILQKLYLSDPDDESIKNLLGMVSDSTAAIRQSGIAVPEAPKKPTGKRKLKLSELVNIIRVTPRVLGAVAVNYQGMVIDGRVDGNIASDEMAALAKGIFDICMEGSLKISLGQTSEMLIETRTSKIWSIKTPGFLLVILTRDDVSMGSLKLKIEDLLRRIEDENKSSEQGGMI